MQEVLLGGWFRYKLIMGNYKAGLLTSIIIGFQVHRDHKKYVINLGIRKFPSNSRNI